MNKNTGQHYNQGTANSRHKLTIRQVAEARKRLEKGESQSSIARSLGVNHSTISRLARGETWKV